MLVGFFVRHFLDTDDDDLLYKYAHYNETILGNRSIILCFIPSTQEKMGLPIDRFSYDRFANRFHIVQIGSIASMKMVIHDYELEFFYTLTHGGADFYDFSNKEIWGNCKTIKHCIYDTRLSENADIHLSVGKYVNVKFNTTLPILRPIVSLPECNESFRDELGIPSDAIVFGHYGRNNSMDVPFMREAIVEYVQQDPNTYFLFADIQPFFTHPHIFYRNEQLDPYRKSKFINTCDAMIYGRQEGGSLAMNVAEFSSKNRPIFTWKHDGGDVEHQFILWGIMVSYEDKNDLLSLFPRGLSICRKERVLWNMYEEYTPELVMDLFHALLENRAYLTVPPYISSTQNPIYPIEFSIFEEKIVTIPPAKRNISAIFLPGKNNIYEIESAYYNAYKESIFAFTCKKAGWDCMRHYEILACGTIPYFIGLSVCPPSIMTFFPKQIVLEAMNQIQYFVDPTELQKTVQWMETKHKVSSLHDSDMKLPQKFATLEETVVYYIQLLLDHTRKYLTNRAMASYILNTIGKPNISSILYFTSHARPDYLMNMTLVGFKQLFGTQCHESPCIDYMYTEYDIDIRRLIGMGFTYSKLISRAKYRDESRDATLRADIINHRYDIVVYGNVHRGLDFFNLVKKHYKSDEIVYMCGEDTHPCEFAVKNLQNFFMREIPSSS